MIRQSTYIILVQGGQTQKKSDITGNYLSYEPKLQSN